MGRGKTRTAKPAWSPSFASGCSPARPATINGDGKYIRDYVYVEDVARANYSALAGDRSEPFVAVNIGTAAGTDVNELEAALRPICAKQSAKAKAKPIRVPPPTYREARAGDLRSNLVDPAFAKTVLNWEPEVPIKEGLQKTATWFAG